MPSDQDPIAYSKQIYASGLHSHKPPFTFQSTEWEEMAHKTLSASSWGYLHGSAGAGSTYRKNLAAFDRYSIMPRRLVPSRKDDQGNDMFPDTRTKVLGQTIPFPIAMAPIGVQQIFHREGEIAASRAAAEVGVPYILSTASSTSIEDVATAHDDGIAKSDHPSESQPQRWFQLYWPSRDHDDITISMLQRAKSAGYTALFVTLDTYILGWRPSDMDNGYNPFLHADRIGVQIGFSDPVFRKHFKDKHGYEIDDSTHNQAINVEGGALSAAAQEWTSIVFPGHSHSWEDLEFLKQHWDGPIVRKSNQIKSSQVKPIESNIFFITQIQSKYIESLSTYIPDDTNAHPHSKGNPNRLRCKLSPKIRHGRNCSIEPRRPPNRRRKLISRLTLAHRRRRGIKTRHILRQRHTMRRRRTKSTGSGCQVRSLRSSL